MTLRGRFFAFSTAQLLGFGLLLAVGYYELETTLLPLLYKHLEDRAQATVLDVAGDIDVALGGDDPKLVDRAIDNIVNDPAIAYILIETAAGKLFYRVGTPSADAFAGPPELAQEGDGNVHAWSHVRIEGLTLGRISIAFDTSPVENLDRRVTWLAIVVLVGWLAAVAYSIVFARSVVAPIQAMKEFSRKVAGGDFTDRLAMPAPGELLELRDYLNQMTRELESRELERANAAERDAALQRELVTMSRMAGMAEVATGVLHNVGNVLNSLNVSVSVVGDQLRDSKVSALSRTVELCTAHPGGFDAFLMTDKGKLLPQFLASVSHRLVEENVNARGELAAVMKNVDHIKSIVATQQRYANTFGATESVDLAVVLTDALRMGEASFARHGVELVRDLETDIPEVVTDRHKLLQILINLISNARHALKNDNLDQRRLTVRMRTTATAVVIAVVDTGVGIPAENLPKIFQHGFTTKADGHGFGLHSSANAARALGGSLVVTSDGLGRGATFTLELPLTPTGNHAAPN